MPRFYLQSGDCEVGRAGSWEVEEHRRRHSGGVTTTLYKPVHVALFEARPEVQNLPPSVDASSLEVVEDEELLQQLDATDPENDRLHFALVTSARHGLSSVSETGRLQYKPRGKRV